MSIKHAYESLRASSGILPWSPKSDLPVRIMLAVPWLLLAVVFAVAAGIDGAVNWVGRQFRR
jgi:hypothetical protein